MPSIAEETFASTKAMLKTTMEQNSSQNQLMYHTDTESNLKQAHSIES